MWGVITYRDRQKMKKLFVNASKVIETHVIEKWICRLIMHCIFHKGPLFKALSFLLSCKYIKLGDEYVL